MIPSFCTAFVFVVTQKVLRNILQWHVDTYNAMKLSAGGSDLQIGIVLNHHQFDPYNYWNPLDCVVAYLVDSVFNEAMLGFFRTGHYHWWTPDMSEAVKHHDPSAPVSNDFIGLYICLPASSPAYL